MDYTPLGEACDPAKVGLCIKEILQEKDSSRPHPRHWDDLQSRASSSVMKRATTRSLNPHSEAIGLALAVRRQIHTVDRAAKGHGTQAQTVH